MPTPGDLTAAAKRLYVRGAKRAAELVRRARVMPSQVPSREHRARHWLYSLGLIYDSVGLAGMDVPWWTYRAIDDVERWLAGRPRPINVFEYGSGASTIWLARRADSVISVEHQREFAERMQPALAQYPDVTLHVVEGVKSTNPTTGSRKEGYAGVDFTDYVATIDVVGGMFDLIVIDGRAREACLSASIAHLVPDGLIVFDNTKRARYRRAIESSALIEARDRGLTPTLPYPEQTSLLRFG